MGELSELESKANVTSLEGLHVARRQLLPEYSALRALHGPGNKWDSRRKAILSAIKVRVRMSTPPNGKWTEDAIDAAAHADDQYAAFIDQGIDSATRYVILENAMAEISERIEDRKSGLYLFGAEARLG